jgi:hypothetical protein
MKVRSILSAPLIALFAGPALALDGGVFFNVPPGATSYTYETKDSDVFDDDTLESGSGNTESVAPGTELEIDFKDLFCDEDNDVSGPDGPSGEGSAEIYVCVTFHFPGGATTTVTSDTQKIKCLREQANVQLDSAVAIN